MNLEIVDRNAASMFMIQKLNKPTFWTPSLQNSVAEEKLPRETTIALRDFLNYPEHGLGGYWVAQSSADHFSRPFYWVQARSQGGRSGAVALNFFFASQILLCPENFFSNI